MHKEVLLLTSQVLQSLIKVLFLFLKKRGHPELRLLLIKGHPLIDKNHITTGGDGPFPRTYGGSHKGEFSPSHTT